MAGEARLPVLAPLESLLPQGGLRRGSTVTVHGSTSLALALAAGASQEGSWCAAVGMPDLGLVAAADLGVALERLALIPHPGPQWATVVAALVDAVDIVLVAAPARVNRADLRRLVAKARERGVVLVPVTDWPEAADVRLGVVSSSWDGLGRGYGHLRARRMEVVAQGRGAAARERRVSLWLPASGGGVAVAGTGPVATGAADRTGATDDRATGRTGAPTSEHTADGAGATAVAGLSAAG